MENKLLMKTRASLHVFTTQTIHGYLYLYENGLYFQADGILKNNEIRNEFLINDIIRVKSGFSIRPFRLAITDKNNEVWIFDYINRHDAKKLKDSIQTLIST